MDAVGYHSALSAQFNNHYEQSSLFDERFAEWTSVLDKYLKNDDLVLDAGCGSGVFSFYAAKRGNRIIAFDASENMVSLCKKKFSQNSDLNIEFLVEKLPLKTCLPVNKFDLILSSSVLEYVAEYEQCLHDFKNLLHANGVLIISLPNKASIYRKLEIIGYRIFKRPGYFKYVKNLSTPAELNRIMEANGFSSLETRFYSSNTSLNKMLKFFMVRKTYRSSLFLGVYKKIQDN